jgi:hypothetical protein
MYVFYEIEQTYFGYKITANVHDIRDRSQIVLKIEKNKVENKNRETSTPHLDKLYHLILYRVHLTLTSFIT